MLVRPSERYIEEKQTELETENTFVCVSLCTTVVFNTAQSCFDYLLILQTSIRAQMLPVGEEGAPTG